MHDFRFWMCCLDYVDMKHSIIFSWSLKDGLLVVMVSIMVWLVLRLQQSSISIFVVLSSIRFVLTVGMELFLVISGSWVSDSWLSWNSMVEVGIWLVLLLE